MKDTIQTINQFKETIIFHAIVSFFLIIVFIVLLCILKKNSLPDGGILNKVWWITVLLLVVSCMKIVMFIPSVVDIFTDNIKIIEVADYSCRYHHQKGALNPGGTTIDFTTIEGERLYGHMLEKTDIPSRGHGYILYAKYSHYILDCDLHE